MNKSNKVLTFIAAIIAVGSLSEGAELNRFTDLAISETDGGQRFVLTFDSPPKSKAKFFEKSIQVDFPQTLATTPNRVFDIGRAGIDSIKIYQFNSTTARIRILPSESMEKLQNTVSMKVRGNKLVINVSMPASPVAVVSTPPPSTTPSANESYSLDSMIRQSVGRKTRDAKASKFPTPAISEQTDSKNKAAQELEASLTDLEMSTLNLNSKPGLNPSFLKVSDAPNIPAVPSMGEALIKVGSALMIVLALVVVVGFGAKKYLSRMEGGSNSSAPIKVLSNHFIGVKKNVTIIEVAGEVLVLGVTNENINLLATYNNPEKVEKFRLAHRTGQNPLGTFKKLKVFSWADRKKKKVNDAFAKQVESYADTIKDLRARTSKEENRQGEDKPTPTKEELVSRVSSVIAEKLRNMEKATV